MPGGWDPLSAPASTPTFPPASRSRRAVLLPIPPFHLLDAEMRTFIPLVAKSRW